jgi:hypothetical protein
VYAASLDPFLSPLVTGSYAGMAVAYPAEGVVGDGKLVGGRTEPNAQPGLLVASP